MFFHNQYSDIQASSSRMLASSEEEEEEDPQIDFEYLLFVMAQTGGFMYFLKTVFGILLSCWNARMFLMEILNKQRLIRFQQAEAMSKLLKNEEEKEESYPNPPSFGLPNKKEIANHTSQYHAFIHRHAQYFTQKQDQR